MYKIIPVNDDNIYKEIERELGNEPTIFIGCFDNKRYSLELNIACTKENSMYINKNVFDDNLSFDCCCYNGSKFWESMFISWSKEYRLVFLVKEDEKEYYKEILKTYLP